MALTRPTHIYQFPTNEYIRIDSVRTFETGKSEENVKNYGAELSIMHYTDSTKEFTYKNVSVTISGLEEYDLQLPVLYVKLNETEEYSDCTAC